MDNLFPIRSGVPELVNAQFIRKKNGIFLNLKISKKQQGLIMFYSPYCKSCETMKEKWAELATLFKNRFFISALNVENDYMENENIRADLRITQYPTIKFIQKSGKIVDYKGQQTINEIVHFICEKEKLDCEESSTIKIPPGTKFTKSTREIDMAIKSIIH